MSNYFFHSFDLKGAIALSQSLACRDDLAALDEGVRRSGKRSVEIWQGDRLVARVKLGNVALNARDPHSL
ncbi:MAG TPA: hypothetical protein VFI23_02875 [Rhizomicrobium sp.]|nr:hypothetical protein [Rhizomicrobium sp.]